MILSACTQAPLQTVMPTIDPAILTSIAPTQEPQATVAVPTATLTPTIEVQPTTFVVPTLGSNTGAAQPSLGGFVITASSGNLTIHRGPGFEYNIVGYFLKGQSYTLIGRNEAGNWLMVSLDQPGRTAWISNMTPYTNVNGNVPGLPVVTVDPAVPAYIYNCTDHRLTTSPGKYYIEAWSKEQVNPYDFYYVYDLDVTLPNGYNPVVDRATVTEGETANVHKDGNGTTYSCPAK